MRFPQSPLSGNEQVKSIKELGDHVNNLVKMGAPESGLAEYLLTNIPLEMKTITTNIGCLHKQGVPGPRGSCFLLSFIFFLL